VQQHDLSSCSDRLAAMGLELSAASLSGSTAHQLPTPDGSAASGVNLWEYALQRHSLYLDLGTDMQRNGLVLGGIITQGLTQDELFELPAPRRGSAAKPKLRHLSVSEHVCRLGKTRPAHQPAVGALTHVCAVWPSLAAHRTPCALRCCRCMTTRQR
jgi:hypothetical protein